MISIKRPPRVLLPYLASARHQGRFDKAAGKKLGRDGAKRLSLRKRVLRWNKAEDDKRPVPLATQRDIKARLQGEVDKLGELIGRDLRHWLQPRA